MAFCLHSFREHCLSLGLTKKLIVGFSGGLDSTVLLDAVVSTLADEFEITACHIHHGLMPDADLWVEHCRSQCARYGVKLEVHYADVDKSKSIETAARQARRNFWTLNLDSETTLLLAHHLDDQAETILFRLFRGTGLEGAAGIQAKKTLGRGYVCRPLLNTSKVDLSEYARIAKLVWIQDQSNANTTMDRNYIRHQIMPKIKARWPQVNKQLSQFGMLVQEACLHEATWVSDLLALCLVGNALDLEALLNKTSYEQNVLLRAWLKRHQVTMPSYEQIQRIHQEVIGAREDKTPLLKIGSYNIRRYRQKLYLLKSDPIVAKPFKSIWEYQHPLLYQQHQLIANIVTGRGIKKSLLGDSLLVRSGSWGKKIKKKFQQAGIPPWRRHDYPLIYQQGTLISIPHVWQNPQYAANSEDEGVVFNIKKVN